MIFALLGYTESNCTGFFNSPKAVYGSRFAGKFKNIRNYTCLPRERQRNAR